MIEVERKFLAQQAQLALIAQTALFVKKESFVDTYYDTKDYLYTLQNIWLRKRAERFELKVGISGPKKGVDRYEEISEMDVIANKLGISLQPSFEDALEQQGIVPFATFSTKRSKFQVDSLMIDVDLAEFGDFTYRVIEIEKIVDKTEEIPAAEDEIHRLAQRFQLGSKDAVKAKLITYLLNKKPSHYQALVSAGVCY